MSDLPPITNNPDVRYLGRVLGDVIRAYGGEKLYERTEAIRSASVERHRGGERSPDAQLGALDLDETLDFVRGFMLFSMLANLAEDRQGFAAEKGADVAAGLERLAGEGIDRTAVIALLDHALEPFGPGRRSARQRDPQRTDLAVAGEQFVEKIA